jgi:hypothetical protein
MASGCSCCQHYLLCTKWLQLLPDKLLCCAHLQLVCWLIHPQLAQHICLLSSQPAGSSTADTHAMSITHSETA